MVLLLVPELVLYGQDLPQPWPDSLEEVEFGSLDFLIASEWLLLLLSLGVFGQPESGPWSTDLRSMAERVWTP